MTGVRGHDGERRNASRAIKGEEITGDGDAYQRSGDYIISWSISGFFSGFVPNFRALITAVGSLQKAYTLLNAHFLDPLGFNVRKRDIILSNSL